MRTVLGILRRGFKILRWIGCGLSALLFVATVVLWVRSLGHREGWSLLCFEPRPDWTTPDLPGQGMLRRRSATAIHGRLWLGSWTMAPAAQFKGWTEYRRDPISGDRANQNFDSTFQPGHRPWGGGTQRAWRFAGAGSWHGRSALDPRIGWPQYEDSRVALPFWMLAVLFGLWPGLVAGRRGLRWRRNLLRRKRLRQGLCLHCGYDLRATPDPAGPRLERCPECGREVVGKGE